jgi:ribosomal protein S18 acetylase RimI-like enzyme
LSRSGLKRKLGLPPRPISPFMILKTRTRDSVPAEADNVSLRIASESDLDLVVRIHETAFPKFFLTALGADVLRLYYRSVIEYRGSIFLVASVNGTTTGFVAGFTDPAGFYRHLRSRRVELGLAIAARLLSRPQLLPRVLLDYRRTGRRATSLVPRASELASLAVLPQNEGQGIGSALVKAFIRGCVAQGVHSIVLTTDAVANDRVNRFYLRSGFRLSRTLESHSRLMNEYLYEVS